MNIRTLLPLFLLCLCGKQATAQQEIDLSGIWEFETDLMAVSYTHLRAHET